MNTLIGYLTLFSPVLLFLGVIYLSYFAEGDTQVIDGITFYLGTQGEGATGHSYGTWRYSTVYAGSCYQISLLAKSFNDIMTYNLDHPDSPVSRYDRNKILSVFERIAGTFKFIE